MPNYVFLLACSTPPPLPPAIGHSFSPSLLVTFLIPPLGVVCVNYYFWGLNGYAFVDLVKHSVLTFVGEIQCSRNDRYYYYHSQASFTSWMCHRRCCSNCLTNTTVYAVPQAWLTQQGCLVMWCMNCHSIICCQSPLWWTCWLKLSWLLCPFVHSFI